MKKISVGKVFFILSLVPWILWAFYIIGSYFWGAEMGLIDRGPVVYGFKAIAENFGWSIFLFFAGFFPFGLIALATFVYIVVYLAVKNEDRINRNKNKKTRLKISYHYFGENAMKTFRKIISLAIMTVLIASAGRVAAYEPPFEPRAECILLVNLDTDTEIYSKNPDQECEPASLTKIMTAVIALEEYDKWESETVTVSRKAVESLIGTESSVIGLMPGEVMPLKDVLACMLISSANDAAAAVAEHVSGSQKKFVKKMNQRAEELGLKNTHFTNPHGLHDKGGHTVTTARDMYVLSRYAMTLPGFMDLAAEVSYSVAATNLCDVRLLSTTNLMMDKLQGKVGEIDYYYGDIDRQTIVQGIKTGFTDQAGRCLASSATQNGYNYLLICMGAPFMDTAGTLIPENNAFFDTRDFYDWVFDGFSTKAIVDVNRPVTEIDLEFASNKDKLTLYPKDAVTALVPNEVEPAGVTVTPYLQKESIEAPVEEGQIIGYAILSLSGQEIGRVDLVCNENIERSEWLFLMSQVKNTVSSKGFLTGVGVFVVLLVIYIVLAAVHNYRKRNKRRPRRRRNRYD